LINEDALIFHFVHKNHRMSARRPGLLSSTSIPPTTTTVVGAAANRLFELFQQADYAQATTMFSPGARVQAPVALQLVGALVNAQGSSKQQRKVGHDYAIAARSRQGEHRV